MRIYAYVQVDRGGAPRIVEAYLMGRRSKSPLVYDDRGAAAEDWPRARAMARASDRPVTLVAFDSAQTLETFEP